MREQRVEAVTALAFVAVAAALPQLLGTERTVDAPLALALVAAFALATRVRLYIGAGYTVPTQLLLVPMLFLLPAPSVPVWVGCGMAASALYDVLARREHPEWILAGIGNSWHAVGPAVVLALAGEPSAGLGALPLLAAALTAQWTTDLGVSTAREWLGRGVSPASQLRVLASVYLIDAALTPVGLAAAVVAGGHGAGFVVVVPLIGVLGALAHERRARIEEALTRLDLLLEERARLDRAIHRIGEALGANLDSEALVELMLRTAAEGIDAEHGRASLAARTVEWALVPGAGAPPAAVIEDAERRARREGRLAAADDADAAALAFPLMDGEGILTVARLGAEFSREERALFGYLAQQAAVAIENVDLHDRLRFEATVDELTGLANPRRLHERLAAEAQGTGRFRRPLALAILEIDGFKALNDAYGFRQADRVLREVAAVVQRASRPGDEPARYRGGQLAVILPGTDIDGAYSIAEAIRHAAQALVVTLDDGAHIRVTVSVGVSALHPSVAEVDGLVSSAEDALTAAKRRGKNRTERGGWVRVGSGR